MCPVCMTTAALVAAGSTSGASALGFARLNSGVATRLRNRTVSHPGPAAS